MKEETAEQRDTKQETKSSSVGRDRSSKMTQNKVSYFAVLY